MQNYEFQQFMALVPKDKMDLTTAREKGCGAYLSIDELKNAYPKGTKIIKDAHIAKMINEGYDFSNVWVVWCMADMEWIKYMTFTEVA